MLRFIRSPAFQRQLATRGISTSRTLFMALQTNAHLTSLNAQAMTHLDMHETLEEVAASHFSESSAFPEFSPKEDVLLGQAIPLIKDMMPIMDAHALAAEELNAEMQQHFCESSDFPEYTPAEEEAMLKEM
ncbi:hypothetical protein P3T76_004005 [Phytophthora citrophthora]|uniref:Uncharacterized protein n=1 Tax=Phytophthora citrophthora TaxID=4793 RepID=A0AAD9LNN6_9STRA|nr:hypothetical protein P3T76_004005 [Phytophthora citrophthora]